MRERKLCHLLQLQFRSAYYILFAPQLRNTALLTLFYFYIAIREIYC